MEKQPLKSEYTGQNGVKYIFEYFETDTFAGLPQDKIKSAHGVCFLGNNFLVVNHANKSQFYGLVGGTVEPGEHPEETLIREVREESNMKVLRYKPIAYQRATDSRGIEQVHYKLRYACIVEPYGPFVSDPAGKVTEVIETNEHEYKKYFDWGEIGDRIIARALELKKSL